MILYCENCGIKYIRAAKYRLQKFCSIKCNNESRRLLMKSGEIAVENSEGRVVFRKKFYDNPELKELMELFKEAPVLIVNYDQEISS